MDTTLRENENIAKLIKEIENLEKDFSEILLTKKNIENELYMFKLDYDWRIAPFYLEKLKIDAQINEILKKRWIPLDRFEDDTSYIPEIIDEEEFESQKEYFENQNTQREKIEETTKNITEDDLLELKKLYKKLAMKFHPDKFASQPEKQPRAVELMQKINEAFQEKNLEKLQQIEAEWFDLQDSDNEVDEDVLFNKKYNLERNIESIKIEIEQLQKAGIYTLYATYLREWEESFYKQIIEATKKDIEEASKLLSILAEMPI